MKNIDHLRKYEVEHPILKQKGFDGNGVFIFPPNTLGNKHGRLKIISSDGGGWDHVSVSKQFITPTWEEMSIVKNAFFKDTETVIQFHPKKTNYINNCETCLHLWRYQKKEHELPPTIMV